MKRKKPPSYKLHKGSGQAYVTLSGRRLYLGKHGSPESRREFRRVVAEWAGNGGALPVAPTDMTVVELLAAFMRYAEAYYRKPDGTLSKEAGHFTSVVGIVEGLYGDTPASDFGPTALRTIRDAMVKGDPPKRKPWSRKHVNKMVNRVRLIWKWGVGQELIPAATHQALTAVAGLKRGRCDARESEPVKPVPVGHVNAIKPHVGKQVWGLIQLQLRTGARPGELVNICPVDIDTTGKVWTFSPVEHKTAHHGHGRTIYLGPRAQAVLKPFLAGRAVDAPIFSPREAEADRREAQHRDRKTPLSCGNKPGSNRVRIPRVEPGDAYTVDSYRRAIARACVPAGVPSWHPHQLRHNAATQLRREFGIEAARVILGHRSPLVTELYAELDREKAVAIVERVG